MPRPPLRHIVRVRRTDDLTFVRDGIMDEALINANQAENSPQSTAAALRQTALPFSIDPVLSRFQEPAWWRNAKGETKRNYARLGAAYVKGTSIDLPAGRLIDVVSSDREWRTLATNAIDYQRTRLATEDQLDMLSAELPRLLQPVRLNAPALVAYSDAEDHANRLLSEASADAAETSVAVSVIVPLERLVDPQELGRLIASIPTNKVSSYFLWTPRLTEERLLADHNLFRALLRLISELAARDIPVGHLHGTYAIAALHDAGIAAIAHHTGWTDNGEPAEPGGGGPRSCRTYVPSLRHCLPFDRAYELGRSLGADDYAERYCSCHFCAESFTAGQHPLDLLIESDLVGTGRTGGQRPTPTSRASTMNTWHYLLSRRQEVKAFSARPAAQVIDRDLSRAVALTGGRDLAQLQRLADELRAA